MKPGKKVLTEDFLTDHGFVKIESDEYHLSVQSESTQKYIICVVFNKKTIRFAKLNSNVKQQIFYDITEIDFTEERIKSIYKALSGNELNRIANIIRCKPEELIALGFEECYNGWYLRTDIRNKYMKPIYIYVDERMDSISLHPEEIILEKHSITTHRIKKIYSGLTGKEL